ncbi:non-structural maintenance of chromosomes element 4, partial [Lecanoromycetidae sp. Uapishka_2]
MARRAHLTDDEDNDVELQNHAASTRRTRGRVSLESLSPSPAASFSSDKENRQTQTDTSRQDKGKGRAMPPPQLPSPTLADHEAPRSSKRRKLSERGAPNATQAAHENRLAEVGDTQFYDPNQSIEERRAIRKDFRDLSKELTDSRNEFLAPGSRGLFNTLEKANDLFANVKQTSDATLDSRLLVSTADLSAKRTTQLNLGDSTTGIDIDDFVGKCIGFMRRGPAEGGSQRRRRDDDSDDEANIGYDEGDAFNWEWLGRQACFPHNVRPSVPGFLLGPLSVQKRVRKATQRRERFQRRDPKDAVRPEELKSQDIDKKDATNLTAMCRNIRELLVNTQNTGKQRTYEEMEDNMSDDDIKALMHKHGIADDEGVPFFHFCVNPQSFGQTIENLFYVSFLIRDGTAGFGNDNNMLPTLHATEPRTAQQIQDDNISKQQAVFHLDFDTWEDIIDAYNIKGSIIPHRQANEEANIGASGWYG